MAKIDPKDHRLLIHGLVRRPLIYTMDELKRLPSASRIYFVECNANSRPLRDPDSNSVQQVHGKSSCSEWTGVLLSVLLRESGVQESGRWVVAEGADAGRYTKSIPIEKAMEDTLVAYAQNGEPVRPEQGFPLRLVVPGWEGINCTKWLRRVKVVDQPYMAKWESASNGNVTRDGKGQWFQFEMGAKAIITRPSGGNIVPGPGFYEISGLAWSGGAAVAKVDISVDNGRTWNEAQLQGPVLPKAHTRFTFPWNWNGQETVIMARCTDARGEVQPTLAQFAEIWGFEPDYFRTPEGRFDHFNAIQPWRVSRDGSIRNAMFS
jgi:sulfane dehydrogenase subunit SoxC